MSPQTSTSRSARDHLDRVVHHFDDLSVTREWSSLYHEANGASYHYHVRVRRVMEMLPGQLGRVLDLGCGSGVLAPLVIDRGGVFLAGDLSTEMVREAKDTYSGIGPAAFFVSQVEATPLRSNSFDQLICIGVIEYLLDPAQAFAEMSRVLKPGGVAVVSVSKRLHVDRLTVAATAPVRFVARRLGARGSGEFIRSGLQPEELDGLARAAALVPETRGYYNFTLLPYPFTRIAPNLSMRVNLPLERWHATESTARAFLARGYLARYRKPAA